MNIPSLIGVIEKFMEEYRNNEKVIICSEDEEKVGMVNLSMLAHPCWVRAGWQGFRKRAGMRSLRSALTGWWTSFGVPQGIPTLSAQGVPTSQPFYPQTACEGKTLRKNRQRGMRLTMLPRSGENLDEVGK